jgi:prefoldin subunit 5
MNWEDILKEDVSELEKIAKELDKAVAMHTSQAKRIRQYVKRIKRNK